MDTRVKTTIQIAGYIALVVLVGFLLYGATQYYFFKKTPTVQNFLPESKPVFSTINNNVEHNWSIGPYIEARFETEQKTVFVGGIRLEYKF